MANLTIEIETLFAIVRFAHVHAHSRSGSGIPRRLRARAIGVRHLFARTSAMAKAKAASLRCACQIEPDTERSIGDFSWKPENPRNSPCRKSGSKPGAGANLGRRFVPCGGQQPANDGSPGSLDFLTGAAMEVSPRKHFPVVHKFKVVGAARASPPVIFKFWTSSKCPRGPASLTLGAIESLF
jgi:hypothetical protein